MSIVRMRDSYEEGTVVAGTILCGGAETLAYPSFHMARADFDRVGGYLSDDVGNVVLSMDDGALLVIVQSIDCDWP